MRSELIETDEEGRYWRQHSGYLGCCGRSRLRGHADECFRRTLEAREADHG